MHGSKTWRQRARKAYVAHLNCRFRLGVGSAHALAGRFYSLNRSRKGRWPRATGLASYLSSRLCLFFAAAHVPVRPAWGGRSAWRRSGQVRRMGSSARWTFSSLPCLLVWGANEVSCQARPARSSFGVFVPRPPCGDHVSMMKGSVFPLAPAPGISGDHPGNSPVSRALLAADGSRSAPIVHPQERPLLGRAGSR